MIYPTGDKPPYSLGNEHVCLLYKTTENKGRFFAHYTLAPNGVDRYSSTASFRKEFRPATEEEETWYVLGQL